MKLARELFDQAPGFMAVLKGPDHVFAMANSGYRELVGRQDVLGRPLIEALPELADQGFVDLLDEVVASGTPYIGRAIKVSLSRLPGVPQEDRYVDFIYQPIREADGSISGVYCQGHDVTEEQQNAAILRAREAELAAALAAIQAIFDHSHDIICSIDGDGVFTRVSNHAEQVWGYRPEELIGRRYIELVHPDDVAATNAVAAAIMAGTPTSVFTNRYMNKGGFAVPVMWSAAWSQAHGAMFAIARDMREHVAAEAQLRQAQKMEAVGRLTGGVAHDFNNLLTVIIGSAETLTDALADRPELQPLAQLTLDAAERGADLVSHLLAFSRKQALSPKSIDCTRFFDALLPILRRTLAANIEIRVDTQAELRCLADRAQLTTAILNLCINASHAMPDGGVLTLGGALHTPSHDDPPGDFVVLSVEDTGVGMSEETIAHALEPFFTTKPPGEGSGLGLSMVYGFVTQSGGRMDIQSEVGRGTRMRLYLPTTSRSEERERAPGPPALAAGSRHIMLVEDDALLRGQVERQLTALGYRVTSAANGWEALERLAGTPDIDLLLTDMVMPGGLTGRQLADHARLLMPDLPVLFTSGHTDDTILRTGRLGRRTQFLAKPYRRAELARKLTRALDDG
jgi:PAS domain S-box-containing protein